MQTCLIGLVVDAQQYYIDHSHQLIRKRRAARLPRRSSSLPTAGFDWSVLTYAPGRPQPPKEQKKKKMSEQERAQLKQERKKNKELVRNFLENYEEDMHKRRLHIKQARRLAAEEDAARMARPTQHFKRQICNWTAAGPRRTAKRPKSTAI